MVQLTLQQAFDLAVQHHGAGRLTEAEQLYRQILTQQPDHPETLQLLGVIAHQVGRNDDALELIHRAIALRPESADAHSNLGSVFKATGRLDEAIAAYRQAITLDPCVPAAHRNLGNSLCEKGRLDEGIAAFREALKLRPDYADVHNHLGLALKEKGRLEEAIAAFRRALDCDPSFAFAWSNLGCVLRDTGQYAAAIAAFGHAIALRPGDAAPRNNLGMALRLEGRLDEALAAFREALALDPAIAEAHTNLGNALKDTGQLDEALAAYRQAIALDRSLPLHHSNLIYALQLSPDTDAASLTAEQARWVAQHSAALTAAAPAHTRPAAAPARPLRLGLVSADFWDHVAGRNLLPWLRHLDRAAFEVTCYANVARPDALTAEFRALAGRWRDTLGLSDQEVARLVREDGIDILFDLGLHTADNRLLVFARRPAPVQASFLGYPGSTGLPAIDWHLSDPFLEPATPGIDGAMPSSAPGRVLRLPDTFWCYDPLENRDLAVGPPPAAAARYVTFGCLNNFGKITPPALALWARILAAVEGSRLLLLTQPGSHRQRVLDTFARAGVAPARIAFAEPGSRRDYLALYHRIDLGLDTFPYNGHNSSLDSLWMGVPVITLAGRMPVGRGGVSLLENLGLRELIAGTEDEYVALATALARDLPRLAALRAGLRARLEASPMMDAPRFARGIEAACRQMWEQWCADPSESTGAGSRATATERPFGMPAPAFVPQPVRPMRIAFADFLGWDFHAASVDTVPMGGSQSAACHLARALAQDGHEVFLFSHLTCPGTYCGVTCRAWPELPLAEIAALELDAVICVLAAGYGRQLRDALGPGVRLILWNQHAHDQAGVQALRDAGERTAYDGFAMVSDWQREHYLREFALDPVRTVVLRNASGPAFSALFPPGTPILPAKTRPPILAYTSTPFRGLDLLLDAFPAIRNAVPGTRLQVFSSMQVYQVAGANDEARFGFLYRRCRETEGVEYFGSLPQPELALRLRAVQVLAYPNSFPETSCIGVIEALASGCQVVTTHLGALPETTGGFARLIPVGRDRAAYVQAFTAAVIEALHDAAAASASLEARLRAQVDAIQRDTVWSVRAGEWVRWLQSLPRGGG
jgi:predicted O-linked N-acetylglucosamine transferase (SPINDLY family)/glycosyltransferase involved in cell wall biosynthesis